MDIELVIKDILESTALAMAAEGVDPGVSAKVLIAVSDAIANNVDFEGE